MYFSANFKELLKSRRFIVKYVQIKNICDLVKLNKNLRDPLYKQSFEIWNNEIGKN